MRTLYNNKQAEFIYYKLTTISNRNKIVFFEHIKSIGVVCRCIGTEKEKQIDKEFICITE